MWVRMDLGARREGWTGPASPTCIGKPKEMLVDAPGDAAALCRFMIFYTGGNVTGKLNGLAETDFRVLIGGRVVEGDFPVGNHGADKDTTIALGLAAEPAPEQECHNCIGSHNRRVELQARRKFVVRIPEMMRVPGQTFEGITADGKRVRGRVPAGTNERTNEYWTRTHGTRRRLGGAPDGKAIAFLTWGSWADGVVEHTGSMLRKFRTRTREGYCPVGRELKLELI